MENSVVPSWKGQSNVDSCCLPATFATSAREKKTISSSVHREVETLKKVWHIFFQSFIYPRIIAAAQIGFMFVKVLHLSFQMQTMAASCLA